MCAEIVNLRRARKARARRDKETAAAENRVRYGRTRAERERCQSERDRQAAALDGSRRVADETGERSDDGEDR